MDFSLFTSVNWVAILVATVALSMGLGMLWYSKLLFFKPWMEALALSEQVRERMSKTMPKMFGLALLNGFITMYVLNILIQQLGVFTATSGALIGALVAIGFSLTTQFSGVIWENRNLKACLISSGHVLLVYILAGALFARW